MQPIEAVKKVDDFTVRFQLKHAWVPFKDVIASTNNHRGVYSLTQGGERGDPGPGAGRHRSLQVQGVACQRPAGGGQKSHLLAKGETVPGQCRFPDGARHADPLCRSEIRESWTSS